MQKITILQKIAKRIRQLRKINKMSQERLAEKADLHPTFIGNIERAETNPTITTLEKIAKAFNISLPELLTFQDDKRIESTTPQMLNNVTELLNKALDIVEEYKPKRKS